MKDLHTDQCSRTTVLDDLPTSTKSAELDDRHTEALLDAHAEGQKAGVVAGVDEKLVGTYLAWLVAVGFLDKPTVPVGSTVSLAEDQKPQQQDSATVKPLPALKGDGTGLRAIGRGSAH